MAGNKLTNIQVYRKKWNINIGVIIFGAVFIYLVVTVLLYLTGNHVTAYEVREGSILKDNAYTGFIVRDETIVQAESDGYINYFALEGSKVGAKTRVYTLSDKKLELTSNTDEESLELTSEEQNSILMKTQSFSENFREEQFSDVYTLKNNITNVLESKSNQSRQAQLDAMVAAGNNDLQIYTAVSDGIILYSTDGYENITTDQVTEDDISKTNYESKNLTDNTKIKAGDPVYKLIRSNDWSVVILLNDETAKELADVNRVKVSFSKDNETTYAGFSIQTKKDTSYGILTFDSSMIRYAEERYLDLELILEDESGLKIPKSSVVTKKFYTVPKDYLTSGGNSSGTGVLVDIGKDQSQFQSVEVYYSDEESNLVYLDYDAFDSNTVLKKPDSSETYELTKTKKLKGVYNINKGYAIFRQVQILCESDEYYIVASGQDYGLTNYDHIALYGDSVRTDDVVF
ncbi:HlyD family efflux transporter periplasmic adaptor subunit [Bariatricus sp. SGI.161]|uniref:HlyD family efflux transporter periplasmic adaptor subunit n=1 Tax=Bariatricus sp. SGI.161 TaxID=3420550 RepID=UPI003CFDD0D7